MIKTLFRKLFKPKTCVSFKQGIDLTDLPICTFRQGKKKLNFLLDTGSSQNIIDNRHVEDYRIKEFLNTDESLTGVGGAVHPATACVMDLEYCGATFSAKYLISDVSAPFDMVKKTYGVNLHGILGSNFFQKYKYVIDFSSLIAYSKK